MRFDESRLSTVIIISLLCIFGSFTAILMWCAAYLAE